MKHFACVALGIVVLTAWTGRAQAQMRDPVVALALLLQDKDTDVRRAAAFALKYFPQAEPAVPALVEAFRDPDEVVRDNAVDAIVLIPPRGVLERLMLALRDTKNPLSRLYAARALGRIQRGVDEAIPDLVLLLKDPDDNVRQEAVEALRRIHGSTRAF